MNVTDAIRNRKSVRQFTDQPVTADMLESIMDAARWAPSGTNTQPWQVYALMGDKKTELHQRIVEAFESGTPGKMDYAYYPVNWRQPYQRRRTECGIAMYQALGIERQDRERRQHQWALNYKAFEAPVSLFFFIDADLEKGSYFDYGMFYQSVMLAAMDHGLATCPQAALAEYPEIVKDFLNVDSEKVLLCGMALGFEDVEAPVNNYRTSREEIDNFFHLITG